MKVVFAPLSVRLDEFVVSVEQNTVQKSDRLVFNIAGTNLAKGNNIYEVLKFAPLVKEENRQLSIIGKESTLLYINGRKTNVPAESMNAYLRGIPAENIAKIEVITNPGATLRDSGNTGIINIELKKNENDGVKGSIYVEYVQRKNNSQYGSLYLDMQKKNLNVTAGLYVNHSIQDAVNDTDYDYFNSGDKERLHENNNTRSLMTGGNVRADYRINPNHTIGMGFDAFHTEG
ncbi:TonB-dependent receptor plug domain-containing protein, partial [Alistipes ihumii]|uniref:TonB-dependent receptor plug domain-containing protein n=1 Tax=Alistipes ihumii TaxID=1470347 RepID=UPI003079009F